MSKNSLRFLIIFFGCILLTLSGVTLAAAQSGQPPADPLALGAWLYGGNCARCHGSYEITVAGEALAADELRSAISGEARGCQVKWSILRGGTLTGKQIDALVTFISAWQQVGGPPELPPLPAFPTPTLEPTATPDNFKPTEISSPTPQVETDPQILAITNANPIALGARLYIRRCYRCHLGYEYGRQANGMDSEKLTTTITDGKIGSSMPAFGWRKGGSLKTKEINAIRDYILAWEKLGSEPALPEQLFVQPTPDPQALQMTPLLQVPPLTGRVEKGLVLYGEYCQSCHGLGGNGALAPSLRKDWNSVRADLTIRSTILSGIPGTSMPAWSEQFDERQINNLVALLLEWSQDPALGQPDPKQEKANLWPLGLLAVLFLPIGWFWRHRTA